MALLTEVTYLYRDASNYKFWGAFRLLGKFHTDQLEEYLFNSEFFIPEKIGLTPLQPEVTNCDDHLLHTFEECEFVDGTEFEATAEEFRQRIIDASTSGWFSDASKLRWFW